MPFRMQPILYKSAHRRALCRKRRSRRRSLEYALQDKIQLRLKLQYVVLHYPLETLKMKCRVAIIDKLSWSGGRRERAYRRWIKGLR